MASSPNPPCAPKTVPVPEPLRRRLERISDINEALEEKASGSSRVSMLLCRKGDLSAPARLLISRARELAIPVLFESEREIQRMSSGENPCELIALEGPSPNATVDELMARDGLVFILVGLRYPANVGFILRSAEVAGTAGIVLANDWKGNQLSEAHRIGIRANRFFPVIEGRAVAAIAAARRAGRRIMALETTGTKALWDSNLSIPTVIVVGGETRGVPKAILESVDDIIRIPTRGFMPSYNVQAAVGMLLGEWLRQTTESDADGR